MVAAAGGSRVFVVTDPGVRAAGIVEPVLDALAAAGLPTAIFDEIEPNPAAATVERGAASLREFGLAGAVVVAIGGGSAMDAAKAIDLRAANDRPVWELEYDGPDLTPGVPIVAVPTTAGTGSEAHSFAVITHEEIGRKDYVGHPSLLPVTTILDPGLTVGLPPAVTAATGIDAMTHSLESLLSANPNPFAEAMALGVIRTVGDVAAPGRRRRHGPRGALADADGLASRGRRAGERHGRRARPRAWPLDRDPRQGRARDRARRRPAGGPPLLPRHPRSRARARRDRARRRVWRRDRSRRRPAPPSAPSTSSCATSTSVRRSARLGLADDAAIDQLVTDTLDDAAIRNSPRLPTRPRRGRSWRPSPADGTAATMPERRGL